VVTLGAFVFGISVFSAEVTNPEIRLFLEYQISRKPAPMLDFAMGLLSRLSLVRSQPGRPQPTTRHSYQF
jgi:hypothetical protein